MDGENTEQRNLMLYDVNKPLYYHSVEVLGDMAKDAMRLPTIAARRIIMILFFVICCTYTTCFADAFQSSGSIRFSSLVDRNPSRTIIRPIDSSSSTALFSSRNFDFDSNDRAQPTRIERTEDERAYIESVLRTNVLFQDVVRQGSLIDLASAFDRVEYKKGDTIFSQGDTDKDYMLILEEGECSITIDGEEIPGIYGTMRPPAMVGELALLMDKDRAATVIAKTNVVAFRLDRASFKYFMTGPLVKAEDIKTEIRNIDHVIDQISGVKKRYGGDIIRQFKPSRRWLWGRWHGTILQQAWKAAATSMLVSTCFVAAIRFFCRPSWAPGQIPDPNFPIVSRLVPLAKLWHYLMSITTFILTFFLSQAYTLWRNMEESMTLDYWLHQQWNEMMKASLQKEERISWTILRITLASFMCFAGRSTLRNSKSCLQAEV